MSFVSEGWDATWSELPTAAALNQGGAALTAHQVGLFDDASFDALASIVLDEASRRNVEKGHAPVKIERDPSADDFPPQAPVVHREAVAAGTRPMPKPKAVPRARDAFTRDASEQPPQPPQWRFPPLSVDPRHFERLETLAREYPDGERLRRLAVQQDDRTLDLRENPETRREDITLHLVEIALHRTKGATFDVEKNSDHNNQVSVGLYLKDGQWVDLHLIITKDGDELRPSSPLTCPSTYAALKYSFKRVMDATAGHPGSIYQPARDAPTRKRKKTPAMRARETAAALTEAVPPKPAAAVLRPAPTAVVLAPRPAVDVDLSNTRTDDLEPDVELGPVKDEPNDDDEPADGHSPALEAGTHS